MAYSYWTLFCYGIGTRTRIKQNYEYDTTRCPNKNYIHEDAKGQIIFNYKCFLRLKNVRIEKRRIFKNLPMNEMEKKVDTD